jgi:hypothetical protein
VVDDLLEIIVEADWAGTMFQQRGDDSQVAPDYRVVKNTVEVGLVGVACDGMDGLGPAADDSAEKDVASLARDVTLGDLVPGGGVAPADKVDVGAQGQKSRHDADGAIGLDDLGEDLVDLASCVDGAGLGRQAVADPGERLFVAVDSPLGLEELGGLLDLGLHLIARMMNVEESSETNSRRVHCWRKTEWG